MAKNHPKKAQEPALLYTRPVEVHPATDAPQREDAMPLPKWLLRIYYIFPIILYVPDVIFNYFVYSKGVSTPFDVYDVTTYPENALWLFLSLGIVGMAWLLSILAPWHWARSNKFQSVMCWFGVLIATAITTWNSLAYRMSQTNSQFPTDTWVATTLHVTLKGFSPTVILVSISPPFWGLFWAIVQPQERRRSAHEEQQSHEARMLKIKLDAEMKAAKANANATVREAQLKGLAASMKAARSQIGAAVANQQDEPTEEIAAEPLYDEDGIENQESLTTDTTSSDENVVIAVQSFPHITGIVDEDSSSQPSALHPSLLRQLQGNDEQQSRRRRPGKMYVPPKVKVPEGEEAFS